MNRYIRLILFFLFLVQLPSCTVSESRRKKPDKKHELTKNHLAGQSSPYLLQHVNNPVDWYPWGEEAFDKAKRENKLVIVSIGYSACHWCHVMEKETFSDPGVAAYMNENFVAIKVDREERPDVDQVYMNALLLLSGSGGWPLNAIALPDGRPIAAGTYFPKRNWLAFLEETQKFYQKQPGEAARQASVLAEGIRTTGVVEKKEEEEEYKAEEIQAIYKPWVEAMDFKKGGTRGAPKFPLPLNYNFMMQYYYHTGEEEALKAVKVTLDNMAMGGIYDQLGGGFARYSTDRIWKVPHFEKMLYDNAQLVSLYSKAWQLTHDPLYKEVVYGTLDFIEREMTAPNGGFYSSVDADIEGEEGKYYIWTKKEVADVLGDDAGWFSDYYNIMTIGNWEKGKNVLYRDQTDSAFAAGMSMSTEEFQKKLKRAKNKLFKARQHRQRPHTDDKIITAWNALMINGYTDAYRAFGEERFLQAALVNAELMENKMMKRNYQLSRILKEGKASINAYLDDYACLADAYMNLYQATFDEKWLELARGLTDYTIQHFRNMENSMFYYTSDVDPALAVRKMEIEDNVTPASNSVMAKVLLKLGMYYYDTAYQHMSKQMLDNIRERLTKGGAYYANWSSLLMMHVWPMYEVAIAGKEADVLRQEMDKHYLPHVIYMGSKKKSDLPLMEDKFSKGETYIYVCRNRVCRLPVKESAAALKQIRD